MPFRQMKCFRCVCEAGSFCEAAGRLGVSQPAVTQQVRALEDRLGVLLLRRHNRTFSLTDEGRHFYRGCVMILDDVERLERETQSLGRRTAGVFRAGCPLGLAGSSFSLALGAFRAERPDTRVEVTAGSHEDLYAALLSGRLDMVVNDQRRAFSDDYENVYLADLPMGIELPAAHMLAAKGFAEPEDLHSLTCVLIASPAQEQEEADFYSRVLGLRCTFVFARSLSDARLQAVSGTGFVPLEGGDGEERGAGLIRVPLCKNGSRIVRRYCAFWRRDAPQYTADLARGFASQLRDFFKAQADKDAEASGNQHSALPSAGTYLAVQAASAASVSAEVPYD